MARLLVGVGDGRCPTRLQADCAAVSALCARGHRRLGPNPSAAGGAPEINTLGCIFGPQIVSIGRRIQRPKGVSRPSTTGFNTLVAIRVLMLRETDPA